MAIVDHLETVLKRLETGMGGSAWRSSQAAVNPRSCWNSIARTAPGLSSYIPESHRYLGSSCEEVPDGTPVREGEKVGEVPQPAEVLFPVYILVVVEDRHPGLGPFRKVKVIP